MVMSLLPGGTATDALLDRVVGDVVGDEGRKEAEAEGGGKGSFSALRSWHAMRIALGFVASELRLVGRGLRTGPSPDASTVQLVEECLGRARSATLEAKLEALREETRGKRARFSPQQRETLDAAFEEDANPTTERIRGLAGETGLSDQSVRRFFQNRRHRRPKPGAEADDAESARELGARLEREMDLLLAGSAALDDENRLLGREIERREAELEAMALVSQEMLEALRGGGAIPPTLISKYEALECAVLIPDGLGSAAAGRRPIVGLWGATGGGYGSA